MKSFTLDDQRRFAHLSGDHNPLHLDLVGSRRLLFGQVVVHGVHTLLWCLDRLLDSLPKPVVLKQLKATFRSPLPLETPLDIETMELDADGFKVRSTGNHCELTGRFDETPDIDWWSVDVPSRSAELPCRDLSLDEAAEAEGSVPLFLDPQQLRGMLPAAAEKLPAVQVAQILATTRLTGMRCPGTRSVFHALELRFAKNSDSEEPELRYKVSRADKRFSIVQLAVAGLGVEGELSTFVRPGPVCQASLADIAKHVDAREFQHHRALIVGGSRGLGELTAKIVAAGGGAVRITYNIGEAEARRVVDQLSRQGTDCRCLSLDVTQGNFDSLAETLGDFDPTHLYYFATPHIAMGDAQATFSGAKFRRFCRYYVEGFASVVESLAPDRNSSLIVLYPSTVFADRPASGTDRPASGTAEYVAAKMAGEALCRHFQQRLPRARFHVARLPRMHTDQTAGISPQPVEDSLETMLGRIRQLDGEPTAT